MNLKGTVTRVFTAKDSGFKILALKVEDLKAIPVEKRNPDYAGRNLPYDEGSGKYNHTLRSGRR